MADLQAELAPCAAEAARRDILIKRASFDAVRGIVAADDPPEPGDLIAARGGGQIVFHSAAPASIIPRVNCPHVMAMSLALHRHNGPGHLMCSTSDTVI